MGQQHLSPGQSEAPPWVNVRQRNFALKGQNSPALHFLGIENPLAIAMTLQGPPHWINSTKNIGKNVLGGFFSPRRPAKLDVCASKARRICSFHFSKGWCCNEKKIEMLGVYAC